MPFEPIPGGPRLFYREAGAGDQPLLLIHGNLATSRWFEPLLAHLPTGIRAVAADSRGCGDSEKPEGPWRLADLAEDLHQLMQTLGHPRYAVLGHSLGGSVALELAVAHPEAVERVLLINAAPPEGLRLPEAFYAQMEALAATPAVLRAALAATAPSLAPSPFFEALLSETLAKSTGAWIRNSLALRDMDLRAQAGRLAMPVRILYGALDRLVTLEMAESTRRQIPGATLEVWPEVGHSIPVEAPQRLARWVAESLTN